VKARRAAEGKLSYSTFTALWGEKMRKHYPDVEIPTVGRQDYGIFKRNLGANRLPAPLDEIFDWVMPRWSDLKRNEFSWAKHMRDLPSVVSFARLLRPICEDYISVQRRNTIRVTSVKELEREVEGLLKDKENTTRLLEQADRNEERAHRLNLISKSGESASVLNHRLAEANKEIRRLMKMLPKAGALMSDDDLKSLPSWEELQENG